MASDDVMDVDIISDNPNKSTDTDVIKITDSEKKSLRKSYELPWLVFFVNI